jgi:preprotein translocase subunit SecA
MLEILLGKVFGTANDRELKRLQPMVAQINTLEPTYKAMSDAELQAQTSVLRERLAQGAKLDEILAPAFGVVREVGWRVNRMRHFDVQLIGGMVLHAGKIAEMRTGEGKTLVATLPTYLNALSGRGVHVVTVNDYLARRDADWMGRIYRFLGLTVGCIQHNLSDEQRRAAYNADITYGTNNEFGFDYLRDNMKFMQSGQVQQKGHVFAIVDEVDSILIDEARTPLIISGPSEGDVSIYSRVDRVIPRLKPGAVIAGEVDREKREELEQSGDYIVDEKHRNVVLTEQGVAHAEKLIGVGNLYDPTHIQTLHALNQALRAHTLYRREVEYVIEEGEVVIIDEFTGRKMPGRRWSDGLHQAVEAKEGVKVQNENQTLATITFQNLFRMYEKLSGMTGTASTEAPEFAKIYNLDVVTIPTNKPMIRKDYADTILKTEEGKYKAVVEEIRDCHTRRQPVLVGTISVEKSEHLSQLLKRAAITHEVLNAKNHAREADIVALAGRLGAVTVATNMAGRGTDILLGGNPEVMAKSICLEQMGKPWADASEQEREAALQQARTLTQKEHDEVIASGGLHIIGTERHEARRIDNQLRGRAGRQGDPGSSRFYLSLGDDLMRRFASRLMEYALKEADDAPIESRMVSRQIERAQKAVETQNFEIRKRLIEYDDVQNRHRQEVYATRRELLEGGDSRAYIRERSQERLELIFEQYTSSEANAAREIEGMAVELMNQFGFDAAKEGVDLRTVDFDRLWEAIWGRYEAKVVRVSDELMRRYELFVVLQLIDQQWKDHLLNLDHLKEGIGMRAYAQKDPLVEYKKEAFELFADMKDRIESEIVRYLMLLEPMSEEERRAEEERRRREQEMIFAAASRSKAGEEAKHAQTVKVAASERVGRNDPCPCGSGKKYKKCHGA